MVALGYEYETSECSSCEVIFLVILPQKHPEQIHTHDGPNVCPIFAGRNSPLTASANLGLARSGIDLTKSCTFGGSLNDA